MKEWKIAGYKLIYGADPKSIEKQVLSWIEKGWQPLGHCQYAEATDESWFYVQTLVKYED